MGTVHPPYRYAANTAGDDSLDPIQDIFSEFNRQANSDSSGHSHSGQSDASNEGDYSYDSDALLSYMAQVQDGLEGGNSMLGMGLGNMVPLPDGRPLPPAQLYAHPADRSSNSLSPASVLSSVSSPAYPYSLPSKGNSPFDFNGASPPFSLGAHDYNQATNLTSSATHFYSPHYPDARSSAALGGNAGQQQQSIPYSANYTPQSSRPLSPPSSASSSNGGFNPAASSNFVHNEAIARMIAAHGQAPPSNQTTQSTQAAAIAQAQAVAQAQAAQAQAAYAANYMANINSRPAPVAYSSNTNSYLDGTTGYGSAMHAGEFDGSPLGNSSSSSDQGGDAKKRRVSPSVLAAPRGGTKQAAKRTSPTVSFQPMAVDEDVASSFDFSIKHETRSAPMQNARSSINVIANAGIAPSLKAQRGESRLVLSSTKLTSSFLPRRGACHQGSLRSCRTAVTRDASCCRPYCEGWQGRQEGAAEED